MINQEKNGFGNMIFGTFLGTLVMFLLDPISGKRRRALAYDQFVHYRKAWMRASQKKTRHLINRSKGIVAEQRHAFHESRERRKAA